MLDKSYLFIKRCYTEHDLFAQDREAFRFCRLLKRNLNTLFFFHTYANYTKISTFLRLALQPITYMFFILNNVQKKGKKTSTSQKH